MLIPCAAATLLLEEATVSATIVGVGVLSGVMHTAYYLALQRGYARGDLSVVYPLARGTGPLFAMVGAVVVLGERPGWVAVLGVLTVAIGVVTLLAGPALSLRAAIGYALVTGALIGLYSVWDGLSVRRVHAHPLVMMTLQTLVIALVTAPLAVRTPVELRRVATTHRAQTVAIGILSLFSYLFVLYALRLAPVSRVAPTRELSIVIATAFGVSKLGEASGSRRMLGSAAIVIGIFAVAAG